MKVFDVARVDIRTPRGKPRFFEEFTNQQKAFDRAAWLNSVEHRATNGEPGWVKFVVIPWVDHDDRRRATYYAADPGCNIPVVN